MYLVCDISFLAAFEYGIAPKSISADTPETLHSFVKSPTNHQKYPSQKLQTDGAAGGCLSAAVVYKSLF